MDSNIISPTSRTRLVVASQALEIQHLQDLLRATERDLSDTSAKLVSEKQDLERRLAQEQGKSKRLDEQVRLLGEKLRQTEQQLSAATAGGIAGVGSPPSPGGGGGGGGGPSRSPNLLNSVMSLGDQLEGNNNNSSFLGGAAASSNVDSGTGALDGHTAISSPQQQQISLMKRVAELQATNSSLSEERDMLRNALEEVQLQLQSNGGRGTSPEINSILAQTLVANNNNNKQRTGSVGLLDQPTTGGTSQAVQTSDPTDSILNGVEMATVEDIRHMIVNEQQLQKYFQQLGVLHASNAQQLADAMQRKIEAEMTRLHQQHEEYRRMLHSVPVVLAPDAKHQNQQYENQQQQQQQQQVYTSGPNVPGQQQQQQQQQPPLVSPFNAAGSTAPAAASQYQNSHVNMTPRTSAGMSMIPPQQQQHNWSGTPGQPGTGFVKQQQHEMSVLKRRLDELQDRHRGLRDGSYGHVAPTPRQQQGGGGAPFLSSTAMPPSMAHQQQQQMASQPTMAPATAAAENTGPVPRTLFPISHGGAGGQQAAPAAAGGGGGGVPAAVGAAQQKMDTANKQQNSSSAGVMQRMFSKAASIL